MGWIYLHDRFVKEEEALVSVFDHGFLYGDGVYETIRSYGHKIFMRDQHLARLRRSADGIGLSIPQLNWPSVLHEAMARNGVGDEHTDAYIRVTISRGVGDIGLDLPHSDDRDHDQTAQTVAKGLLSDRREPDRGQDQAKSSKRAGPTNQGHEFPEQHPGETRSAQRRGL
jgi:branched-subunit amino acid aminotransferase/4-amino-4-deoxychorismate lyase